MEGAMAGLQNFSCRNAPSTACEQKTVFFRICCKVSLHAEPYPAHRCVDNHRLREKQVTGSTSLWFCREDTQPRVPKVLNSNRHRDNGACNARTQHQPLRLCRQHTRGKRHLLQTERSSLSKSLPALSPTRCSAYRRPVARPPAPVS